MSIEGSEITSGHDGGGWRQFLDGIPLCCGASIDLLLGEQWISGYYEMVYPRDDLPLGCGLFCVRGEHAHRATQMAINHTMRFRRTPRE